MCRECFFAAFEDEVHKTITDSQLFKEGDKIAVGASGGKGLYSEYGFNFMLRVCRIQLIVIVDNMDIKSYQFICSLAKKFLDCCTTEVTLHVCYCVICIVISYDNAHHKAAGIIGQVVFVLLL